MILLPKIKQMTPDRCSDVTHVCRGKSLVSSTAYPGHHKRNIKYPHHRSFVIPQWPMDSPHKEPTMWITFACHAVIVQFSTLDGFVMLLLYHNINSWVWRIVLHNHVEHFYNFANYLSPNKVLKGIVIYFHISQDNPLNYLNVLSWIS